MPASHTIEKVDAALPCSLGRCHVPTFFRAVYVYSTERIRLPRCPAHLALFALAHQIEVPKEAV